MYEYFHIECMVGIYFTCTYFIPWHMPLSQQVLACVILGMEIQMQYTISCL